MKKATVEPLESVTLASLIEQGYLTPVKYFATPPSFDAVPLGMSTGIGHTIVNPYLQHASGKRAIVFCATVQHCEMVTAAFINAGVPAASVLASQNRAERDVNIERLQQGSLLVLTTCNVLLESKLPEVDVVIVATPTASRTRFSRFVAAAVVPAPEPRREGESRPEYETRMANRTRDQRVMDIARSKKPFAMILDVAGNVLRLGMPDAVTDKVQQPAPTEMVSMRTSKLTGPALRYAVASAEGLLEQLRWCWLEDGAGIQNMWTDDHGCWDPLGWEIGGPLIEKYHVWLSAPVKDVEPVGWDAEIYGDDGAPTADQDGCETVLLAVCRAVVMSKLGAVVQIPADIAAASGWEAN
jgi:hypothetical protein